MNDEREASRGASSRRHFLNVLLGVVGLGWLASILYPVLRYLKPVTEAGPGGPTRLSEEELAEIREKGFVIIRASGRRVIVLAGPEEELRAFSAVCTHEACTVQYLPQETIIWCACHDGKFGVDGRVISGPPPRPLPRYRIVPAEDGQVLVEVEEA